MNKTIVLSITFLLIFSLAFIFIFRPKPEKTETHQAELIAAISHLKNTALQAQMDKNELSEEKFYLNRMEIKLVGGQIHEISKLAGVLMERAIMPILRRNHAIFKLL